ncbi:hypothetical protein FF011L_05090 [Roseimaritima multifibrata]|uniref:Uncharacterized protein n=1 Tax=Roseimaritima multifibrata TaxID=1930274 RepID=A0A517MA76_9BACT|nr:hypothetical protein [Roseimaritima multifibrata]QDS91774.1 hypothetical protein FF011L_05090 [Roseimaritima multifibrata]
MAKSEQSRQKKLAKKRSKEIAKRKQLAAEKNALNSIGGQIAAASRGKFHQCYIYETLLEKDGTGIGAVIAGRLLPDGNILFACFLVDQFCLGVKDAFARAVTPRQFSDHISGLSERSDLRRCDPAFAKKYVVDSVLWAEQFGLVPHQDYTTVSKIWADVDQTQCDREFSFGKDGEPCFIPGPNDSPDMIRRTMEALATNLGDGKNNKMLGGKLNAGLIETLPPDLDT